MDVEFVKSLEKVNTCWTINYRNTFKVWADKRVLPRRCSPSCVHSIWCYSLYIYVKKIARENVLHHLLFLFSSTKYIRALYIILYTCSISIHTLLPYWSILTRWLQRQPCDGIVPSFAYGYYGAQHRILSIQLKYLMLAISGSVEYTFGEN